MVRNGVDYVNIGLILLSLGLAIVLPFRLFVLGYAILGPLHYFTEINWLQSKNFFTNQRKWEWIPIVFVLIVLIPHVVFYPPVKELITWPFLQSAFSFLAQWTNSLIFLWFVISVGLIVIERRQVCWQR